MLRVPDADLMSVSSQQSAFSPARSTHKGGSGLAAITPKSHIYSPMGGLDNDPFATEEKRKKYEPYTIEEN